MRFFGKIQKGDCMSEKTEIIFDNTERYRDLGCAIAYYRKRKNLTQEQLAEMVDLSPMHISVLERGAKPPKLETLINIANALGVTADVLLQDLLHNRLDVVSCEANELISKLPMADQRRVMEALRGYVDATDD